MLENNIAIYLDFENLVISANELMKEDSNRPLKVRLLVDQAVIWAMSSSRGLRRIGRRRPFMITLVM
jgi:hypothetical protein